MQSFSNEEQTRARAAPSGVRLARRGGSSRGAVAAESRQGARFAALSHAVDPTRAFYQISPPASQERRAWFNNNNQRPARGLQ